MADEAPKGKTLYEQGQDIMTEAMRAELKGVVIDDLDVTLGPDNRLVITVLRRKHPDVIDELYPDKVSLVFSELGMSLDWRKP